MGEINFRIKDDGTVQRTNAADATSKIQSPTSKEESKYIKKLYRCSLCFGLLNLVSILLLLGCCVYVYWQLVDIHYCIDSLCDLPGGTMEEVVAEETEAVEAGVVCL